MCDTSGWGSFKVTYEGCCVINTGTLLRVDQGDGRGRYAGAWWEWDCGSREGREVVVGIVDREKEVGKEKERRKKGGEKSGAGILEKMNTTAGKSKVVEEIIVEEVTGNDTQEDGEETREDYYRETQEEQEETQMDEDPELDGAMEVDV